jgi:hypothetical protein
MAPHLTPDLAETLERVMTLTAEAVEPWWIIGSAAMALHGAAGLSVADVDLLMGRSDARRLTAGLAGDPRDGTSDLFRSEVFGRLAGSPLPIDVMAGFRVRDVELRPSTRRRVKVGAGRVFVPELDELIAITASFGRAKDLERVAVLEALRPGSTP